MKSNIVFLAVLFSCGGAFALPQDWPCDKIELHIAAQKDAESFTFKGKNKEYALVIDNFVLDVDNPISYNCGAAGCLGTITDLKTQKSEELNFECSINDSKDILTCGQYITDEYLFTKYNNNEYRVNLCNSYFLSIQLNDCTDCFCVTHNSKSLLHNKELICNKENEQHLRCFTYYGYENYIDNATIDKYNNCVGMKVK